MTEQTRSVHYDSQYFEWQQRIGAFGGEANLPKFAEFVRKDQAVLDFGCGGGYLLKSLDCAKRLGVEINPAARAQSAANGIEAYASLDDLCDNSVDVVVSNHALEHVDHPLSDLRKCCGKLRPGGIAVFVVPCEGSGVAWQEGDINQHLYSWSPMSLGNLFVRAGFDVMRSEPYLHRWPPGFETIQRTFGWAVFHFAAWAWGRVSRTQSQVRVVARRRSL